MPSIDELYGVAELHGDALLPTLIALRDLSLLSSGWPNIVTSPSNIVTSPSCTGVEAMKAVFNPIPVGVEGTERPLEEWNDNKRWGVGGIESIDGH